MLDLIQALLDFFTGRNLTGRLNVAVVVASPNLEIAVVAPCDAPRVLDLPVVDAVLGRAIANHLDGVIGFLTGLRTHHHLIPFILVEGGVVGPNRDCHGAVFDEEVLELVLVALNVNCDIGHLVVISSWLDDWAKLSRIRDVVVVGL